MSLVRCFVAVDLEDPAIASKIAAVQEQLKGAGAKLKLVELENLHLTLRFIGEIPRDLIERVVEALRGVEFTPFTVHFVGLGAFPNPRRPRVIWVGVEEGSRELSELSAKVNSVLAKLKLPKPEEEFTPHLTIARVKSGVGSLPMLIEENKSLELGSMLVDRFRLKKSTLTSRGPIYETLFEVKARSV